MGVALRIGRLLYTVPQYHRHPPEPGLRHAINVLPNTLMAKIYGEGEIVVNSEHRQAIQRVAKGFAATGIALDNVIEAIEHTNENWFAVGVQWQPASPSRRPGDRGARRHRASAWPGSTRPIR